MTVVLVTQKKKNLSMRPRVRPKCGTHTSSALQTHLIIVYRSKHDSLHLEDFLYSDVDFCLELEFNQFTSFCKDSVPALLYQYK